MFNSQNLTAEQRLTKAVVAIMHNPKYFALAGVLMLGTRKVESIPPYHTAKTNGRDEWYDPVFVDTLTDPELRFLVLHECFHKLYKHLITWKHLYAEDAVIANMACDYVINLMISDDNINDGFATMPRDKTTGEVTGCIDEAYRGMDAQQVFALLKKKEEEQQSSGGKGAKGDDEGNSGSSTGPQSFDEHDWEGAEALPEEEQQQLARDIDNAIRQGAMLAGKAHGSGGRDFSDLLSAQVNWAEQLREFITQNCAGKDYSTYRRPNRRFMGLRNVYMPSAISERIGEIVFGIDVSVSIGQKEITAALSEAKSAIDTVTPEVLRILYWGSSVVGDEKYEAPNIADFAKSTKPMDGGGTSPSVVVKYMEEHNITPQIVVMVTDGYVGNNWGGAWPCPVLWVVFDNKDAVAPSGKTVHTKTGEY